MSILPIIHLPDPVLRKVSAPIERVDDELCQFLDSMAQSMYDATGIGLAGVQVGELRRIITIDCGQHRAGDEVNKDAEPFGETLLFLINPEIVSTGDELSSYNEGCLSIPDYMAEVDRPATCTVSYTDKSGIRQELEADGLLATCLQHEIDHLDGKLFIDYLSRLKRDSVIRKFTKLARQEAIEKL